MGDYFRQKVGEFLEYVYCLIDKNYKEKKKREREDFQGLAEEYLRLEGICEDNKKTISALQDRIGSLEIEKIRLQGEVRGLTSKNCNLEGVLKNVQDAVRQGMGVRRG